MKKITKYLNEHLLGEVTNSKPIRQKFSRDGSVLTIMPEIIVHPRTTNDIRKVTRFAWQLAEKGHIIPITTRGGGSDQTGAAIGKGIILNTVAHLNKVIYVSAKSKDTFVHVQPGIKFETLNESLKPNGVFLPTYPTSASFSTIGGAIANNAGGPLSGKYGFTGKYVKSLEVVLANGDIIETRRISRRELDKLKGMQTFEGELYRKIDGIIEDNQQIIDQKINDDSNDNFGYSSIKKVKNKDGSFDLTPLIIGSQGTLGIVSEAIVNLEPYNEFESVIIATFTSAELTRDAADQIAQLKPATLKIIDGAIFQKEQNDNGKHFIFSNNETVDNINSVMVVSFDDVNERSRKHSIKKALKKLSKFETNIYTDKDYSIDDINVVREISSINMHSESDVETMPPLMDGATIAANRREEFVFALNKLASKHHVNLPVCIDWLSGVIHTRPIMHLHQISDRQKVFKLISDYIELIDKFNGDFVVESSEGRVKATAIYNQIDKDLVKMFAEIKQAFDPFGILNPEVKQKMDLKTLVSELNNEYSLADFAKYSPKF